MDKYLDLAKELKKMKERECEGGSNCSWNPWYSPNELGKETEELGVSRNNQNDSDIWTIEID